MGFWIILFLVCVFNLIAEFFMVKTPQLGEMHHAKSNNSQKTLNLLAIAMLALVAGLRNVGGTDFSVYRKIYNSIPTIGEFFENYAVLDDKYSTFGAERMYLLLNSFCKTIHLSYYGFIFLHSMFILFTMYFALRKYTFEFTIVIFVCLYKFYFCLCRSCVAVIHLPLPILQV